MMKKKNYLHKAVQGALIGTSFLLLNGLVSCSDEPMDSTPAESTMTRGSVGPSGQVDVPFYFPAGQTPTLDMENYRYGFIMSSGYFSFHTAFTKTVHSIEITMENSTRTINAVEATCANGCSNIRWRQTGSRLSIYSLNDPGGMVLTGAIVKIWSDNKTPLIIKYKFL